MGVRMTSELWRLPSCRPRTVRQASGTAAYTASQNHAADRAKGSSACRWSRCACTRVATRVSIVKTVTVATATPDLPPGVPPQREDGKEETRGVRRAEEGGGPLVQD